MEFDRSAPAFYSGPVDLTSAVEVDGEDVISAIVPAQIRSITTLDNSLPALNFLEYGSKFGESIAHMGDLNQDGFTDIMMATFYYVNKTHIGDNFFNVYYLGENGTSILEIHQIPMHGTNMPPPPPPSAKGPIPTNFGDAIQKLEDQNGDGYVDLLVSATTYLDDTDSNTGLFYVIFLGQGGTSALGYYEISGASISDLDLESEGFEFQYRSGIGTSFTVLGDINSDGGLEIVAGSTKFASIVHDGAFNGQGGVHVLSLAGPDDLVPHVVIKPNTTANTAPTSLITLDASSVKII